jgi:ATP-dependent Clp protease ATP-binding subunit ClpB
MAAKFTRSTEEALQQAQAEAIRRDHQELQPEHLLYALTEASDESSVLPNILQLAGVSVPAFRERLSKALGAFPKVSGESAQIYPSPTLSRMLVLAEDEAKKLGDEYVSGEHFVLALLSPSLKTSGAGRLLSESGLAIAKLTDAIKQTRGGARIQDAEPEGKMNVLKKYCRDLTELARKQKLDPVIGRDEEIRRVVQVLSRRTKNNPVLIGEPGVGKTAIVEGLALRIAHGDVPEGLKDKRLPFLISARSSREPSFGASSRTVSKPY